MSLIKRADVKNHLSARHRAGIHLTQPESHADATGFPHEESVGADQQESGSVENPLIIPSPTEPETAPIIFSKSAQG